MWHKINSILLERRQHFRLSLWAIRRENCTESTCVYMEREKKKQFFTYKCELWSAYVEYSKLCRTFQDFDMCCKMSEIEKKSSRENCFTVWNNRTVYRYYSLRIVIKHLSILISPWNLFKSNWQKYFTLKLHFNVSQIQIVRMT